MEIKHFESPCRGGQNYVSPSVHIVELHAEGVLCASGDFTTPVWERDEDSLDF